MLQLLDNEITKLIEVSQQHACCVQVYSSTKEGIASGTVLDNGYILTNQHVVESANNVDILYNNQVYSAEKLGEDKLTDLALLKIDYEKPAPSFVWLTNLKLGQLVIAIGNPLGFQSSVSIGIISGMNRDIPNRFGRLMNNMIQCTTSINPGNSGGPLLNINGDIVGITTASIIGTEGMHFAIPSNTATWVGSEIATYGEVVRGFLGIAGRTVICLIDDKVQKVFQIDSVAPGSPATKILESGDKVFNINSSPISFLEDIHKALGRESIGQEVPILFLREGKACLRHIIPEKLEI